MIARHKSRLINCALLVIKFTWEKPVRLHGSGIVVHQQNITSDGICRHFITIPASIAACSNVGRAAVARSWNVLQGGTGGVDQGLQRQGRQLIKSGSGLTMAIPNHETAQDSTHYETPTRACPAFCSS